MANCTLPISLISSPTTMAPASVTPFQVRPNSLRLSLPVSSKPALVLP
jgi:hypothetical protein